MTLQDPVRVILADPPWQPRDSLPGRKRGARKHYATMSTRDLCALRLPPIAADAILFLWRLASMQLDAFDVARAWGFEVRSELVWVKTRYVVGDKLPPGCEETLPGLMGMGHYSRLDHEVCLICGRGRAAGLIDNHDVRSVVYAPRGQHSEKPEATYAAIERMIGDTEPRVELFARRHRPGWVCVGNALGIELGFGLLGGSNGSQ